MTIGTEGKNMAKRNRRNRERAGGRTLRRFAAAALIFLIPPGLGADSLNLTTWYPAPYGVYSQLRSTGNSYFAYQGGNVGIGTANPGNKLEINGPYPQLVLNNPIYGAGAVMHFRNAGTTAGVIGHLNSVGGLQFSGSTPASVHMTIDSSGSVGIGTASPAAKLDVAGNTQLDGVITMPYGGKPTYIGNGGYITGGWSVKPNAFTITPQTDFAIGGWSRTTSIWTGPWLYVDSTNGNVGIGTNAPGSRLDLGGASPPFNNVQVFSANGTFVVPPGVSRLRV